MSKEKFSSGALEVNLAQTRRDKIVIPPDHQQFIDFSKDYWGIQQRTLAFFRELNHPLANYSFLVEEFRKIMLGDSWLYEKMPEASKAFLLLLDIAEDLLEKDLKEKDKGVLLRTLLEFAGAFNIPPHHQEHEVIKKLFGLLNKVFNNHPMLVVRHSGSLKKHFNNQADHEDFYRHAFEFSRKVAFENLEYWEQNSQTNDWFEKKRHLFCKDYSSLIRDIDQKWFSRIRKDLEQAQTWEQLTRNMPLFPEMGNHFYGYIEHFEKNIERFYYIIFLLHLPGMEEQQDQLLWELNKILRNIHSELHPDELIDFISNIFNLFQELKATHMSTVLDCILTLGKEVIEVRERRIISFFENELINLGFVAPGKVFIQENWQLKVDPNHVKNIRVWLELIEHAPYTFRKLLSALIVNLRMGGIFIFDTDLFQRDVTKLLNSNISPLYKQIKQLTRIFPVYFSEIGAEGELREVTTMMDEVSGRQDKLIHFLRKQVHIEGNNSHIELTRKIFLFWHSGQIEALQEILPPDVFASIDLQSRWFKGVHQLVNQLCIQQSCRPEELLQMKKAAFFDLLDDQKDALQPDVQRVKLLFTLYFLLSEKYSFEATDIGGHLRKYNFFPEGEIKGLTLLLEQEKHEEALEVIFDFMERLNQVIFNTEFSEGWENIYHKRHIAFGIPSMYGQYRENKFEALGMIFRLERLASGIMEQRIQNFKTEYITAHSLKESFSILSLFRKGLELDGVASQGFEANLMMLKYGLTTESFSLNQFINLFQFMAKNVKDITNTYFFGFYDQPLRMIIPQLFDPEGKLEATALNQLILEKSETFYREILYSSFLIQLLDNFISRVIHSLHNMVDSFSPEIIRHIMSYDPDLVVSPLYEQTLKVDNQIFLGSKAYFQKKLLMSGFPVPPGFVLTTEVFRRQKAITSSHSLSNQVDALIRDHLKGLEAIAGHHYGQPDHPLLLSVRSGTAISMPGAMNTFLNVGLNDRIVEAFSKQPNFGWTSWDCYRRLLQSWGMTFGINRDVFDQVMVDFKNTYQVEQKIQFSSAQMREMAFSYKEILNQHDVHFEQDPWLQLRQAIMSVFDSWSSERAKAYRSHLQIADQWGTAVVIQKMVLGNISEHSGTGVAFTHNPQIQKPGIYLNGDFTLCSQGEDIVAGLVHALPISELQKQLSGRENQTSLEEKLPRIFSRLYQMANELLEKHGFGHQEIEFTFESENPEDLYILQIRDQDTQKSERITLFSDEVKSMKLLARGIGGGGGALSGLLAIDMEDIVAIRKNHPGKSCILMRPDTVPDDIPLIFECDGLVTSRGGTTSHAAVTAARLGKVCVLNCIPLRVDEKQKQAFINGRSFKPGDPISIDGFAGNIFEGHYPTQQTEIIN
ncbi:MAG: PEP/pyruvate-binding domain-containing protein [Bacteroidales bacterium]